MDRDRAQALTVKLAEFPRVGLVPDPTPLDHLANLGRDLGLDFWMKREDLTPIAFGGDKPRKLDFELGKALAEGADTIVTCGSSQSNHARLTTSAARRLGLDAAVVLSRDDYTAIQGNLLTVALMGADITVAEGDDHWALDEEIDAVVDRLRRAGRHPYYIPVSGTTPLSCLGYVEATLELLDQMESRGPVPTAHYVPFGTGGIFTATLLTYRWLGVETPLIGVSVNVDRDRCLEYMDQWWSGVCDLLSIDPEPSRFEITDEFIGSQYGDATPAALDAITLVARSEGILLDPVYSGKVMSALVAHRRAGQLSEGATTLMVHSGGSPALFAYHDEVARHLDLEISGPAGGAA